MYACACIRVGFCSLCFRAEIFAFDNQLEGSSLREANAPSLCRH